MMQKELSKPPQRHSLPLEELPETASLNVRPLSPGFRPSNDRILNAISLGRGQRFVLLEVGHAGFLECAGRIFVPKKDGGPPLLTGASHFGGALAPKNKV